jgi:threonine dehydratase
MAPLVALEAIRDAARTIGGVARITPLVEVSGPRESPLLLKCENLQVGGAFKIRGALNMVGRLSDEARRRGVITYSSGNHGRALAIASHLAGARAVVVMPTTAPAVKVDAVRDLGAEVIFEGTTSSERKVRAEREAAARGLTVVPPFDHEWIIAGQGTIGLELLDQCPDLEEVYVPIGGGGLVSGVAAAIKQIRPSVRVVGVEPSGAARMIASLAAGRPMTLERAASIADGLLPVRPGDLTFAHVRAYVDSVVTIEDDEIAATVDWLFREAKLVVEPSGAASVAAVRRARKRRPPPGRAVALVSGGNIAPADLLACVQGRTVPRQ